MSAPDQSVSAAGRAADGATAAKGAVFISIAKIYFMLSGFVQQVLLTRFLGLADYGAFAVVNNVISIVNNTVVQATIQAVSKFTAENDARAEAVQRAGVRMQVVLGAALALALFWGAPFVAAFVHAERYTTALRIAALIPFLYAVYAVFVGSANGLRQFRTQATFDIGFSTSKTISSCRGPYRAWMARLACSVPVPPLKRRKNPLGPWTDRSYPDVKSRLSASCLPDSTV